MIPELGQLCLVLAFLASLIQGGIPLLARLNKPHPLLYLTKPLATINFILISSAFSALFMCYITSDFTVLAVVLNSHTSKPLLYKIVGTWGNHEGSMLLWMWVLAACGFLVAFIRARDNELRAVTLAVLGLVSSGFLAFILFTSNPFLRVFPPPANGNDLNPILQDIGLAFHPPTLYVGYVGFGIVFCYAIAGLLLGRIDSDWAKTIRPWILLPWSFLTLGIGAGSWWAYRTLGWGGWWFWDPVENVSLLPWLVGTALLHSNMVLERRGQLGGWVALLAILTFTMSLIGTFIVRSGLVTSVHAFAADPTRGMFILGYIVIVSGGGLLVYSFSNITRQSTTHHQAPSSRPLVPGSPAEQGALLKELPAQGRDDVHIIKPVTLISRSGFILINNLLLLAAAGIVLIAILYPLGLELMHRPGISVGAPYFNSTFLPMTAAIPLLAALAPLMAWDTAPQTRALAISMLPALLIGALISLALIAPISALATLSLALTAWLLYGTARYLQRIRAAQVSLLSNNGLRHIASASAHLGLALFVLGMGLTTTCKQTYEAPLTAQKPMVMGHYTLNLIKGERITQNNFITRRATLQIMHDGHEVTTLTPELRYYPVRSMQTAKAALYSMPWRDIYVVMGEANYNATKEETALGIRMYVTPGQQLIWAGFLLAGFGGLIGLWTALRRKDH